MTAGVYDNWYTSGNCCPTDAGDIGGRLRSCLADADGAVVGSSTSVADIDITIARGDIDAGEIAQCDVAATSAAAKCCITDGSIGAAGGVSKKRKGTDTRVGTTAVRASSGVVSERI